MFNLVKIHVHAKHRVLEDGDTSYAKKIAGEVEINDRDVIQGKSLNMKAMFTSMRIREVAKYLLHPVVIRESDG
jgi:hypothetical protein